MANFNITGIEGLSENEKSEANRIIASSYEKIRRKTKVDFILEVVVKIYSKGDLDKKKKHFSIKVRTSGTVRSFESGADDWDMNKALHKALSAIETEIEHAFHSSEQH